ncbi:MAG: DUF1080 domain-containing protein [Ktedonobacteraceae bacterium]|nr:DUF1080 domain-containing protein [Ktedonobacteraceae bacterium]
MTRDTKRLHTHTRLLIGVVCSLLIIGSSAILLILHNTSGLTSSQQRGRASLTPQSTHALATSTPTPPTATSSATAEGITPTPTPIFADDFSDNSQGWYINNVAGYTRSLTSNGLILTDTNHNPMIESLPTNHKFDDFILTTTLTLKQGDNHDSVGVYLRGDSNLDHDYRIDIFGNNTYAISKEYLDTGNIPRALYIIPPTHSTQLKPRGDANTLTVIMKGPTMILLINGKLVNAIIDEDYTHGQIALFVANGATSSGVTAVFSSIEIDLAPEQFPLTGNCMTTPTSQNGATPTSCSGTCGSTPTSNNGLTPATCK